MYPLWVHPVVWQKRYRNYGVSEKSAVIKGLIKVSIRIDRVKNEK